MATRAKAKAARPRAARKDTLDRRRRFTVEREDFRVYIDTPRPGAPEGLLATASLYFFDGPLRHLTLCGFGVWKPRREGGTRTVSLPATYSRGSGTWRRYGFLRAYTTAGWKQVREIREEILEAYKVCEFYQRVSKENHEAERAAAKAPVAESDGGENSG